MRFILVCWCLVAALTMGPVAAQADTVKTQDAKILAMGDSLMAWHMASGNSIADAVGRALHEPVTNRAMGGAKIIHGLPLSGALGMRISAQFSGKSALGKDWVILNGGGNDLYMSCGCGKCDRRMARLISPDGTTGEIPKLVAKIRATGARVAYIGYLRSPGVDSSADACLGLGNTLEQRLDAMARKDKGVHFISLADMVKHGDKSMHGIDMVHPSRKASQLIGQRVAGVIGKADRTR
jgi:lysophospholipase L1-like esterase